MSSDHISKFSDGPSMTPNAKATDSQALLAEAASSMYSNYASSRAQELLRDYQTSGDPALHASVQRLSGSVSQDHAVRTEKSLADETAQARTLSDSREDDLVYVRATASDLNQARLPSMTPEEKLMAFRDDAGISTAIGEHILSRGTRVGEVGPSKYSASADQMDLGGRAMYYLLTGEQAAQQAESTTRTIIDHNTTYKNSKIKVDGTLPTQAEITGLQTFQHSVRTDLSHILSQPHNVNAAINQVVKDINPSSAQWASTFINPLQGLEKYYSSHPTTSPDETRQVMAKLYRSEAIVDIAAAKYKLEHGGDTGAAQALLTDRSSPAAHGAQTNPSNAQDLIAKAARLDPSNADLSQIKLAWTDTVGKAEKLAKK